MKIKVYAFGKLKTPGLRDAAHHYLKGISRWADIQEVELKPVLVEGKSPQERQAIQDQEASILFKALEPFSSRKLLVLLDEGGKSMTTLDWAQWLGTRQDESLTELCFCIGGSLGFSEKVREKSRFALSLGPQTLPHELARVVLLEQIFRSLSVLKGHPYHNEGK